MCEIDCADALVLEVLPSGPDPFRSIKDARSPEILDGCLQESRPRFQAHRMAAWPIRSPAS